MFSFLRQNLLMIFAFLRQYLFSVPLAQQSKRPGQEKDIVSRIDAENNRVLTLL